MAGSGETLVNIGDETFVLKCTLDAFRTIPAHLDGFIGAFSKLAQASPDACIVIIAAGTGKARDFKEHDRIAGLLFENGLANVIPVLTQYVDFLSSGGMKRAEAQSGDAGE